MTNHVHLLVTPRRADSLPRTMQSLGRGYVRHINATYRRTGTLWEGRYRAAPIDSEALGGARFKRQIAAALGRRVAPMPKGRPPKHKPDRRQLSPL